MTVAEQTARMCGFFVIGQLVMHANQLYRWHVCGLSREEVMAITGRSERTVRAWDAGRAIPPLVKALMAHHAGLRPPSMHPSWSSWQFRQEWIVTPAGRHYTERDLTVAVWLLDQWKAGRELTQIRR